MTQSVKLHSLIFKAILQKIIVHVMQKEMVKTMQDTYLLDIKINSILS